MRWSSAVFASLVCIGLVQPVSAQIPNATLSVFTTQTPVFPRSLSLGVGNTIGFSEELLTPHSVGVFTLDGKVTKFPVPCDQCDGNGTHLAYIESVVVGGDGDLWFLYTEVNGDGAPLNGGMNSFIGRFTPTGQFTKFPVPTRDAFRRFDFASTGHSFIASGPDGNFWFTENSPGKIGKITRTGAITEFPLPSMFAAPSGITTGPDGKIWFTETAAHEIGRLSTTFTLTEFTLPRGAGAADPFGIATAHAPTNLLWYTDRSSGVGSITTDGVVNRYALEPGAVPSNITVGGDGAIYFPYLLFVGTAGDYQGKIARLDPATISASSGITDVLVTDVLADKAYGNEIVSEDDGDDIFISDSKVNGSGTSADVAALLLRITRRPCDPPITIDGKPSPVEVSFDLTSTAKEDVLDSMHIEGLSSSPPYIEFHGDRPEGVFYTDDQDANRFGLTYDGSPNVARTYDFTLEFFDSRPCSATVHYRIRMLSPSLHRRAVGRH